MRSVAIATISRTFLLMNYGSFFQHFALRRVLKGLGFRPFRVLDEEESLPWWQRALRGTEDLLRPPYWTIVRLPSRQPRIHWMRMKRHSARIFVRDYRRLIGPVREPQDFNAETIGIRGGDQVLVQDSDRRWLAAVRDGNPRIVYAASTDWTLHGASAEWRRDMADRLDGMTVVGLREEKGLEIVRPLVRQGLPMRHVADPVQLLTADDFRAVQAKQRVFCRPTLLCYLLNIASHEELALKRYEAFAAALDCDLRFIGIQGAEQYVPKELRLELTPTCFLRALDDAAYFVTNSYHGSVFATLYHKRFLSVRQKCPPGTNQNERQRELMTSLGLKDFWMDPASAPSDMLRQISVPIDWPAVDAATDRFRAQSLAWLKENLKA